MITLCIPVLNRYDLLEKCLLSAEQGSIAPDRYLVIDNGRKLAGIQSSKVDLYIPHTNLGVASSWNFFIRNTEDIRIITNDDIEFQADTIEKLVNSYEPSKIISASSLSNINAFSLFIIPQFLVNTVGYFDETISPNWAYYEDNDYAYRMKLLGCGIKLSDAIAGHLGSATLKSLTPEEESLHHNRFNLARTNYKRKWGGEPGHETYLTPYNS